MATNHWPEPLKNKSRPGGNEGEDSIEDENIVTHCHSLLLSLSPYSVCPFTLTSYSTACLSLPTVLYAMNGKWWICTRGFAWFWRQNYNRAPCFPSLSPCWFQGICWISNSEFANKYSFKPHILKNMTHWFSPQKTSYWQTAKVTVIWHTLLKLGYIILGLEN